jgi:hypothetical protein
MKPEEERIRELFQILREEDERNAPSFTHDWNVAMSHLDKRRLRRTTQRLAAAAALTLAVTMAIVITLLPRPKSTIRLDDAGRLEWMQFDIMSDQFTDRFRDPSIVAWRSPTDYLLRPNLNPEFSFSRLEFEPFTK